MRWIAALTIMATLAACSEVEMCKSGATRDLRIVQGFIKETNANLARGYALEKVEVVETVRELCKVLDDGTKVYCNVPEVTTEMRPKAIDLDAEAAKLASLTRKRDALAQQAKAAIAACEIAHPE